MTAIPQEIRLNATRDTLTLVYADGAFALPAEFLRVHSPSAEVRGHGKGQETLQIGKRHVLIEDLIASGNYALKIVFSDGHDSGLYDWSYLHMLCHQQETLWADYLARLHHANASREPTEHTPKQSSGCSGGSCTCKH